MPWSVMDRVKGQLKAPIPVDTVISLCILLGSLTLSYLQQFPWVVAEGCVQWFWLSFVQLEP